MISKIRGMLKMKKEKPAEDKPFRFFPLSTTPFPDDANKITVIVDEIESMKKQLGRVVQFSDDGFGVVDRVLLTGKIAIAECRIVDVGFHDVLTLSADDVTEIMNAQSTDDTADGDAVVDGEE